MNYRPSSAPRILVVEDEWLVAATLETALSEDGFEVVGPAACVEDALALIETRRPHAALLDYRLAQGTSEPLLAPLKSLHIPIGVLTGFGHMHLPAAYGNAPVLEKPYGLTDLLAMAHRLISIRS